MLYIFDYKLLELFEILRSQASAIFSCAQVKICMRATCATCTQNHVFVRKKGLRSRQNQTSGTMLFHSPGPTFSIQHH
jgi:hypothetical protein